MIGWQSELGSFDKYFGLDQDSSTSLAKGINSVVSSESRYESDSD